MSPILGQYYTFMNITNLWIPTSVLVRREGKGSYHRVAVCMFWELQVQRMKRLEFTSRNSSTQQTSQICSAWLVGPCSFVIEDRLLRMVHPNSTKEIMYKYTMSTCIFSHSQRLCPGRTKHLRIGGSDQALFVWYHTD